MQTKQLSGTLGHGRPGRCLLAVIATPALLLTAASGARAAELTADTSTVSSTVTGAIVDIVSTETFKNVTAAGTGMILTSTGEILTNNHVVNGATSIEVTVVASGRSFPASVVGTDPSQDVAVIQLTGATGLQTMPFGDSTAVQVGQSVTARGNGEGAGGQPNVVTGKVTALNQSITATDEGSTDAEMLSGLIETDAPIVPGDSGGPLSTAAEQVIGMDTAASTAGGGSAAAQAQAGTQAFAIPIQSALTIVSQIEQGQASSTVHIGLHGFLGIELQQSSGARTRTGGSRRSRGSWRGAGSRANAGFGGTGSGGTGSGGTGSGNTGSTSSGSTGSTGGVRVAGVIASSAAEQAGLVAGDLITSMNGQAVDGPAALNQLLNGTKAGQMVSLGWTDVNGQSQTGTTKLQAAAAD